MFTARNSHARLGEVIPPGATSRGPGQPRRSSLGRRTVVAIGRLFLRTLNNSVFFSLLMFRALIRYMLRLACAFSFLAAWILLFLSWSNHWNLSMLQNAGVMFVGSLALRASIWYYDLLILKFVPRGYQFYLWN